MGMMGIKY